MTRRNRSRPTLVLCAALAAGMTTLAFAAPTPKDAPNTLEMWSSAVWQSALDGRSSDLEKYFTDAPREDIAGVSGDRFKQNLSLRESNRTKAQSACDGARADAQTELDTYLASGDLIKALESAVEVQTLSPDMNVVLDDPKFTKLIAWAKDQIPQVEERRDWLYAQELLYTLRTLFEDTGRRADYQQYDEHLERVNRRVSLLAMYAPKQLFDMQNERLARHGNEPLAEYNPAQAIDWKERVESITVGMLKQVLRTAAKEHIESSGYRPLITGGLEQLELFATTSSLKDTFDSLNDEKLVTDWVNHIHAEQAMLDEMHDDDIDSITCSRILDGLVWMNDKTIKLPRAVIYREFGEGAMYHLDKFTEIVWPEKLRRFQQATQGNFVGIGILIRHSDKQEILVVNPLEGTPAYFAGVKPEDIIVEVNGETTIGWSLNDAVDRITGEPNSKVEIGIKREGEPQTIRMKINRTVIKLPSVRGWWKRSLSDNGDPIWDWYIDPVSKIAYIRLTQFTEDSYDDLLKAWQEITKDGKPRGLIFDMRYNPGGLLDAAVKVSNLFVSEGVIVAGEDKVQSNEWKLKADPRRAAWKGLPTVVLINKGSASASEIVAGALKAYGVAVLVGERSYGKGSVQTVLPITGNSQLKLTTQYFRLPESATNDEGPLIHKRPNSVTWGVDPHVEIAMTPAQIEDSLRLRLEADVIPLDDNGIMLPESPDRPDVNRMLSEGMDPQLETALLILQARVLGDVVQDEEMKHAALSKP